MWFFHFNKIPNQETEGWPDCNGQLPDLVWVEMSVRGNGSSKTGHVRHYGARYIHSVITDHPNFTCALCSTTLERGTEEVGESYLQCESMLKKDAPNAVQPGLHHA